MGKGKKPKKETRIQHIKCVWGIICSLTSTDENSKNISLFNIIEQFNLPQVFFDQQKKESKLFLYPIPHQVVLFWKRTLNLDISDEKISVEIVLKAIDPSGKIIQEILQPFELPQGCSSLKLVIQMAGLIATAYGDYSYRVELKLPESEILEEILSIPFAVKRIPQR